jgi:hypothetical protein
MRRIVTLGNENETRPVVITDSVVFMRYLLMDAPVTNCHSIISPRRRTPLLAIRPSLNQFYCSKQTKRPRQFFRTMEGRRVDHSRF